ncbi:MarR family winged helix-turn-helix transcriptional regulator [Nocardioides marmoriginsengisoli]|nr:MarR family transcriptional regulator [Nocardioides marmoriginsengisoli]
MPDPRLHPALLMFIAFRSAEARIVADVAAAGFDDLTLAQGRVAARIGPNGTRLTDLAEQAQITKQSAGFLVDQLEKAGYVERVPDPTDARARLVRLAPRGAAVQARARRTERAIERDWERHLGKEQMEALRSALEALREITDPYA